MEENIDRNIVKIEYRLSGKCKDRDNLNKDGWFYEWILYKRENIFLFSCSIYGIWIKLISL